MKVVVTRGFRQAGRADIPSAGAGLADRRPGEADQPADRRRSRSLAPDRRRSGIGDEVHRALLADDWADSGTRPNQLRKLIDVQVVTRKRQLGGDHPGGRDLGITLDGDVVGRILLDLDDDSVPVPEAPITLVDIAVHPDRQRQGIGSEVLRSVLAAAGTANRPVRHSAVFGTRRCDG